MTGKRLMIGSAAMAIAGLVGVSGASAFDGHRSGGGGHVRGEGAHMGSGFGGAHVTSPSPRGASGVATGPTIAGHGYTGRYAGGYRRGYGVTTGRTVAGQGQTGRYAAGYGRGYEVTTGQSAQSYAGRYRYGYERYGYGALGAGVGLGLAGWGWGYPSYAYASGYDGGYPSYAYNSGYDWGYPGYASDSGYSWGLSGLCLYLGLEQLHVWGPLYLWNGGRLVSMWRGQNAARHRASESGPFALHDRSLFSVRGLGR
jgi:hypothetical protein